MQVVRVEVVAAVELIGLGVIGTHEVVLMEPDVILRLLIPVQGLGQALLLLLV